MRLTLAWLCVCLAIYCTGGFTSTGRANVVLSLPPSLIAATEAVALRQLQQTQQQQQQQQPAMLHEQPRWKKDARVLFDSGNDAPRDMAHSKESLLAANGKYNLPYNIGNGNNANDDDDDAAVAAADDDDYNDDDAVEVEQQPTDFNRKALSEAYDLKARQQSAPQEIVRQHGHRLGSKYATPTPHKYWTTLCPYPTVKGNCPREYNRAMLAVRNRVALARLQQQLYDMQDDLDAGIEDGNDADYADMATVSDSNEDINLKSNNNEVFMLLTGEQDLVKFLHWAMQLLYPQHSNINNSSSSSSRHSAASAAADYYHPGMFIWKKLNFSGHLEPPLIVDEPHYVLVRREQQNKEDASQLGDDLRLPNDPFIPPRGRKHNSPDLGSLLNRYETFMPNRGKRDKVKDMFKYDDLFFPNRGKKTQHALPVNEPFYPHRGKKLQLRDLYSADDPFFPNRGKRQLTAAKWEKLQRKLVSGNHNHNDNDNDNDNDKGDNWPQRMSTHEINGNDQSVKPSMSAIEDAAAAAEGARLRLEQLPANRLHSTRSMSANLQQQQPPPPPDLQRLQRLIVKPGMRQQVKRSWPAARIQRLQRSVVNARGTQLMRGLLNAAAGHDTDTDIDHGQLDM